jgi:hypothetical protein
MPKVSKDSAKLDDHGPVEDRHQVVGDYTVNFLVFREAVDSAPLLKGLPGDSCTCPHWGYVFKGRLTFVIDGSEEIFEPGDAFYAPAGHLSSASAGSEYLQFSPTEDLQVVEAVMMKNMQEMQNA